MKCFLLMILLLTLSCGKVLDDGYNGDDQSSLKNIFTFNESDKLTKNESDLLTKICEHSDFNSVYFKDVYFNRSIDFKWESSLKSCDKELEKKEISLRLRDVNNIVSYYPTEDVELQFYFNDYISKGVFPLDHLCQEGEKSRFQKLNTSLVRQFTISSGGDCSRSSTNFVCLYVSSAQKMNGSVKYDPYLIEKFVFNTQDNNVLRGSVVERSREHIKKCSDGSSETKRSVLK